MSRRISLALISIALLATACTSPQQWGYPRTPVSAPSPDGRFVATVRNHPNIDPPSQTIWLGIAGVEPTKVKTLAPDADWCNTIVWSSDSSTVAFLVQDARLITVNARPQTVVSEKWLTDWKGEYPPSRMVQNLSLSAKGDQALFRDCLRLMRPGYVHEPSLCGEMRVVTIRP